MNTPIHADYKAGKQPIGRSFKSRLSCTVAVAICALFAFELFKGIPRFAAIFEDFDTELPHLTLFVIQMRIPLAAAWALVATALVVKEIALKHRRDITQRINVVVLAVTAIAMVIATFGLFLPLMNLFQSVN